MDDSPGVNREEEVDRSLVGALAESTVQALVAEVGGCPDLVLEGLWEGEA